MLNENTTNKLHEMKLGVTAQTFHDQIANRDFSEITFEDRFGMAANRKFYTVKYIRLSDLLGELAIARGEGRYQKVVKQYKQVKLLVIDEWLLFPINDTDARDVLDIINARHKRASTIFCSQFAPEGWYQKINEPTVADAICDRIVHDSYKIVIEGTGMRERKGLAAED